MSPAVSKARTPKLPRTAWPGSGVFVCLVDRAKSSQTVLTFDIQQTISTSELPLANRAYQSIKVVESRAGMCDFGGALRQIQV